MLGVVLWSDPEESKAVIWCEDHRGLAFIRKEDASRQAATSFDPGDLVEFDIETDRQFRYAHNTQVVAERHFPGLSEDLARTVSDPVTGPPATAQIIPFQRPDLQLDRPEIAAAQKSG